MTTINDSFFFAHAMEIRLLFAVGAIVTGFALIKIAALIGELARTLRGALAGKAHAGHLSAIGAR